jgi:serpin B
MQRRVITTLFTTVLVVGVLLGAADPVVAPAQAKRAKSAKNPKLSPTDVFELGLYRSMAKTVAPNENVILSPYSVTEALAMIRGGARGKTAAEIDSAIVGKGASIDPMQRKGLRANLLAESIPNSGTYIRVANSAWLVTDYPLDPSFSTLVNGPYAAKTASLNFATDPEGSAKQINAWVSDATEKQIEELVDAKVFNELTRLVLVNAVLFHGKWFHPFDAAATAKKPFLVGGNKTQVDTMVGTANVTVTKTQVTVELFYTGDYRMRIIMPKTTSPVALDSAMASLFTGPRKPKSGEACGNIGLHIPKWRATSSFLNLKSSLGSLGVNELFNPQADLTGVSPKAAIEGLYVSAAVHKATITVDEKGTTAAAATAEIFEAASAPLREPDCPTEVSVDRPFVYVIQHISTGQVLFAGRLMNPAA